MVYIPTAKVMKADSKTKEFILFLPKRILPSSFVRMEKVVKAESKTKRIYSFFAEAHPTFFIRKDGKGSASRAESKIKT
jgi:hypothetical protein